MPRFKTGWDPDAQLGRDLLGRFCLMRREKVAALGGIRPDRAPAHHYDLHCRLPYSISPTAIRHIPEVLYHRRPPFSQEPEELARGLDSYANSARLIAQSAASNLCGHPVEVTADSRRSSAASRSLSATVEIAGLFTRPRRRRSARKFRTPPSAPPPCVAPAAKLNAFPSSSPAGFVFWLASRGSTAMPMARADRGARHGRRHGCRL